MRPVAVAAPLSAALRATALCVAAAGCAVACAVACSGASRSPVEWGDLQYPATPPAMPAEPHVATNPGGPNGPGGACPGSLHTAVAGGDTDDVYAAWWAVRPDSSAVLMAAHSANGGATWNAPVAADTLDVSRRGCDRPAPSIYADRNGYVHFVYFLEAREGPGVFFTHTMRGRTLGVGEGVFHAPVPIVYGEKPAAASVAASGDTVVVAYEDPNSERSQVDVALSRTTGHIFEERVPVSTPSLSAESPRVALRGNVVTVTWLERPDAGNGAPRVVVRTGRWR